MISANSPLSDVTVGQNLSIDLGDSAAGYIWSVPQGSLLPPGMILNPNNGQITGSPTIPGTYTFYVEEREIATRIMTKREFLIQVNNSQGMSEASVRDIVVAALSIGGRLSNEQDMWLDQSADAQGRKVFSLKINDNGQTRTAASIVVP
jgi:hypothetical protein